MVKHKHIHKSDPVPYPNVAMVYEKRFKRAYASMLRKTMLQIAEKLKGYSKEKN